MDFILSASGELFWKREYMLNFENSWNPKKDAFDLEMTKIEEKILFLEFLFDKDVNQKIKSSEIENLEKIKNFETKMKMQKSNSVLRAAHAWSWKAIISVPPQRMLHIYHLRMRRIVTFYQTQLNA